MREIIPLTLNEYNRAGMAVQPLTDQETELIADLREAVSYLENMADTRREYATGSTDKSTLDGVEWSTAVTLTDLRNSITALLAERA